MNFPSTNRRFATLLLLAVTAAPNVRYFRYDRPILNTPAQKQQACLTVDPAIFPHAGPNLSSIRLYDGVTETPYALNNSAPPEPATKTIALLNTGTRNRATSFDAAMPESPYSNISLVIDAKDFIATVRVSGSQTQTGPATGIGSFTVFDFTRQKLGRSTALHLPQSDFRYLHFRIDGSIRPEQITGLTTGRLPATEPQYVTVATSSTVRQQGRDTLIDFTVPISVPIDRILFAPGLQPVNFSREVTVEVAPTATRPATDTQLPPVYSTGNLLRIHSTQNGHKIDEEHLALEAPYFVPMLAAKSASTPTAKWTIAIHNQDDAPIDLRSVALQMIARTLCFDAQPGATYRLYYGDAALNAPRYDYALLFSLDKNAAHAALGAEESNPQYQARPDMRPFTEKHPALLWIALIAAILLLGVIALRSSRQLKPQP